MQRIGVRELRQHASRYLALVARGEQIEVTDRGRPIAMIVPVRRDELEALVASQRAVQPRDDADVIDEQPGDYGVDASGMLKALRESER